MTKETKRFLWAIGAALLAIVAAIVCCDLAVSHAAKGRTFDNVEDVPARKVGLLLGTSPYWGDRYRNFYFENRIEATLDLIRDDKIIFVIVSGGDYRANGGYDEPVAMRDSLMAHGVLGERIILDYDGTRTINSIAKLRDVYEVDSVVVISQKYHNERALYQARELGIDAVAYNAITPRKLSKLIKNRGREYFARVKLFWDILCAKKQPIYHQSDSRKLNTDWPGYVTVEEVNGMRIYTPDFRGIYLTCGHFMPECFPEYVMAVAAPYTGSITYEDPHMLIAGGHVSDGVRHKGYDCDYNTGVFVYWDGKPLFVYEDTSAALDSAVVHGGVGFGQDMIICRGEMLETAREKAGTGRCTQYRTLCMLHDTLRIIESVNPMPFTEFKDALVNLNVEEAIYTDMGGNSAGWCRGIDSIIIINGDKWAPLRYSNFLVFTK